MGIKFDNKSGEILDLLWSLYYSANYEYVITELEQNNIEIDESIERVSKNLMNIKEIDKESIKFFFNRNTRIFDALLQNNEVFGKTLQECLNIIESRSVEDITLRLVKELLREEIKDEEKLDKESKDIVENDRLFDFIKNLNIEDGGKWNLFCFVSDVKVYVKKAAELIRSYEPHYYKEIEEHKDRIDRFNEETAGRLKEYGKEFLCKLFKSELNLKEYDEINVIVTYLHYYSLYFYTIGKSGYVVLGVNYESILSKLEGINDIEKTLTVLKNLSDQTRFEIVKLLLKKNYFGQELAAELNITTATVSYHMSQLFAANLIELERMEHKAFYKLKKDTIRKVLEFIIKELRL